MVIITLQFNSHSSASRHLVCRIYFVECCTSKCCGASIGFRSNLQHFRHFKHFRLNLDLLANICEICRNFVVSSLDNHSRMFPHLNNWFPVEFTFTENYKTRTVVLVANNIWLLAHSINASRKIIFCWTLWQNKYERFYYPK